MRVTKALILKWMGSRDLFNTRKHCPKRSLSHTHHAWQTVPPSDCLVVPFLGCLNYVMQKRTIHSHWGPQSCWSFVPTLNWQISVINWPADTALHLFYPNLQNNRTVFQSLWARMNSLSLIYRCRMGQTFRVMVHLLKMAEMYLFKTNIT